MAFQPGDNVQGCIVPRLIGRIICLFAKNLANRSQLVRENALPGLVAVLYTSHEDGATPELHMWALRATGVNGGGAGYVFDAVCFVYTCRRLIGLCLIAGMLHVAAGWRTQPTRSSPRGYCRAASTSSPALRTQRSAVSR